MLLLILMKEILYQHHQVLLTLEHLFYFVKIVYELKSRPNFVYELYLFMVGLLVEFMELMEVLNLIAAFTERTFHLLSLTSASNPLANLRFA